jgi:hypothetical protein
MRLGATCFALVLVVAVPGQGGDPHPLRGAPLRETGLRLLVASDPPFVLDVDRGTVSRVAGVPPVHVGTVSVVSVAGRAGVVVADGGEAADLYALRSRRAAALGTGTHVWPAAGGGAVWVQSRAASGCRLRQVGLDGRLLWPRRPFPCATASDPAGGSLGLVVNRTRIVDPRAGRVVVRTRAGILAVVGRTLVLLDGRRLVLLDAETRVERSLGWPSVLVRIDHHTAVDPRGRYVVLAFAEPAGQALDLWLLDVRTARLTQLPSMPALVALKATSIEWTDDGRLVLLGESGGRDVVAVWRPGDKRLRLKAVELPERDGGSDTFAPLG